MSELPSRENQPNLLTRILATTTALTAAAIMYMPTQAAAAKIELDPEPPKMEKQIKSDLPTDPKELAKLLLTESRVETISEFNDVIDYKRITFNGKDYVFGDAKDLDRVFLLLEKENKLRLLDGSLATRLGLASNEIWKAIKGGLFPEMMAERGAGSVIFTEIIPKAKPNFAK